MSELLDSPALHDSDRDFSLVVVRHEDALLLGRKTRGFGAGNWVLPGGKDKV